ncbi:bile acid:sodium symporter family protein [Tissierella sp.]|uniref:bile acid:sodium symporter family protein n=1 Tax=Tissierella sp. TaxID=41274 RepID=UPI0028A59D34|nr:bile acid:sodium symporter family protein [Tissierella sp.]
MKNMIKLISKNHGIVLIVFTIFAFITPELFMWVNTKIFGQSVINILLGVIMFGMGITLILDDFKLVFKKPIDIIKAGFFQFTIMPLLAFLLSKIFGLDDALMLGVVLVGTCPGGTASNVITYLAGGDVALSVAMTTFSTLLAPILTPLITYVLINRKVDFDPKSMFISIIQIVIIPICLGLIIKYLLEGKSNTVEEYMPALSSIAISSVVAGIIAKNVDVILSSLGIIVVVVVIHNLLGLMIGFLAGKLTGMGHKKSITLAIEVGLQNSGLASSLAATHFPSMPLATIPGALFSAWQNIAGSIFAWYMKNQELKENKAKV